MSALPAVHPTTMPAFHLPPRITLSALVIADATILTIVSTVAVEDRDLVLTQPATNAAQITAPCDLGSHRDAWWASHAPTPDSAVSAPCHHATGPRVLPKHSLLPAGRKPAAWYIGVERAATPQTSPTAKPS